MITMITMLPVPWSSLLFQPNLFACDSGKPPAAFGAFRKVETHRSLSIWHEAPYLVSEERSRVRATHMVDRYELLLVRDPQQGLTYK